VRACAPGQETGPALAGPSGNPIFCWGEKEFILTSSGKQFKWTLLLADVKFPILCVDFLRHYNLLVDPTANKLLLVAATAHSPPAHVAVVSPSSATMGTPHTTSPLPSFSHSGPVISPHPYPASPSPAVPHPAVAPPVAAAVKAFLGLQPLFDRVPLR
jgi:hypothetical protein